MRWQFRNICLQRETRQNAHTQRIWIYLDDAGATEKYITENRKRAKTK